MTLFLNYFILCTFSFALVIGFYITLKTIKLI